MKKDSEKKIRSVRIFGLIAIMLGILGSVALTVILFVPLGYKTF
ncbi:MAG: hypothetical protein K0R31_110 [Clostridiales bacterium]|jgi:hypothetical protein|nr:hypothetical protein [Clostridiales bacterium]